MPDFLSGLLRQPDKPTLAGLLQQPTPNPLAAALQNPSYIGGALRDPQFYSDVRGRLADLLRSGVQDVLPTGAGPIMARQGYQADPNYMQKLSDVGLAGMTAVKAPAGSGIDIINVGNGTYSVRHASGAEIGRANLSENGRYLTSVRIDPEYQRQGIGERLYDFIENSIGAPLTPSPTYRTPAAESFWQKRIDAKQSD